MAIPRPAQSLSRLESETLAIPHGHLAEPACFRWIER